MPSGQKKISELNSIDSSELNGSAKVPVVQDGQTYQTNLIERIDSVSIAQAEAIDTAKTEAINDSKDYSDTQDADVLQDANDYSDTRDAITLTSAQAYADAKFEGIQYKNPVDAATTGNITLSGIQTIDGVTTPASVLVKSNTDATENGIYIPSAGAWARRSDMNSALEFPSAYVEVKAGTVNADTQWKCTNDTVIVGTTNIIFTPVTIVGVAFDANVVHNTGNEPVAGVKTFSSSPIVPAPTNATDAANKQFVVDTVSGGFTGYDLITYEGQSNIEGRGKPYSEYLFAQDPDIFILGQWNNLGNKLFMKDMVVSAREPMQSQATYFGNYNTNPADVTVSHAISFAKEYKRRGYLLPGRKILLCGYGFGGTGFSAGDWIYPTGACYLNYIRNVKIALNITGKDGNILNNKIVARLRHQGEADAGNASFQTQLDAYINGTNSDLSAYYAGVTPPFIIGGMGDQYKIDIPTLVTIDAVLKDTPNRIAKTAYYQAAGLKSNNDIYGDSDSHFNAYAQFEMGIIRAADAYENALLNTNTSTGKLPNRLYAIVSTTPATNTIRSTWELAPTFGTGAAVTGHTLRWRISGTPTWTTVALGAAVFTYDLTGITTGVEYDIQVRAENAIGVGLYSKSARTTAITISATIPQSAALKYIMPLTADANDSNGGGFNGVLLGNPTVGTFGTTAGMGASCLITTLNNQGVSNAAVNAAIFSKAGIFKPNFAGSANTRMGLFLGDSTKASYFRLDLDKVSSVWSMRVGIVNGSPTNWPAQVITSIADGTVLRIIVSVDNARGSQALKVMVNGTIYNFVSANSLATDSAQYYGATAALSGGNTFIGSQKHMVQWNGVALTDAEMMNMDLVLQGVL